MQQWIKKPGGDYTIQRHGVHISSLRLYCKKWSNLLGSSGAATAVQVGHAPSHAPTTRTHYTLTQP